MAVQSPPAIPSSGQSERCTGCGNPMAADQRYCLNCGKRRGSARVEFEEYLNGDKPGPPEPPRVAPPAAAEDNRPEREVTPLMAAVGLAGLAAILIMGVLIGRTGDSGSSSTPVVATGVPAATTAATTTGGSTTTTTVEFTADWPEGKEGFTIELATLPKDGSDGTAVEAAKTELVGQGATEVGALDSDEYTSLPAGNYVLYSGVYDTKAEAETALEPLKASFPDAEVVEVSASAASGGGTETAEKSTSSGDSLTDGGAAQDPDQVVEATDEALQALDEATGDEYQEQQKKLPPTIETPGEAPPKDNKEPGGGGDAVTIG